MQTKAKENSVVTSAYNAETQVITYTVLGYGEVEFDLKKVAQVNRDYAEIHGWGQRIPDSAAIPRADKDGNIIPEAERNRIKGERMNDLCRFYESGTEEWARKGGDGSGARVLTIEAIARVKGVDYDRAEALLMEHAEMHKIDRKAALKFFGTKSAKVKQAMLDIQRERLDSTESAIDADAALDEMGSEEAE